MKRTLRTNGCRSRICDWVLCLLILPLLGGCGALPDASGLVESAWSIHAAVNSAGGAVEAELRRYEEDGGAARQFAESWAVRTDAVKGIAEYAGAIQSVVEAAGETRQRIAALADGISGLAGAAGIVLPPAGIVAVTTEAAGIVLEQINRIRAANSLEEAMAPAQEAVDYICGRIAADLRTTDEIVQLLEADARSRLQLRWGDEQAYRARIEEARRAIFPLGPAALEAANQARLRELDDLLAATDGRDARYQEEWRAVEQRAGSIRQVIAAAASSVEAWPSAHAQLRAAVASGRSLNVAAAMNAVVEIRNLVERMRDL